MNVRDSPTPPSQRLMAVGLTFVALSLLGMLWVVARGGSFAWQITVLVVGLSNVGIAWFMDYRERARR